MKQSDKKITYEFEHNYVFEKIKNKIKEIEKNSGTTFKDLRKSDKIISEIIYNLESWLNDDIPKLYKKKIIDTINNECWNELIEAFYQKITFGTNGIRGKMIISENTKNTKNKLNSFHKNGFNSNILRGPNTINEITLLKYFTGIVTYMKKNNMNTIVVGFDNRVSSKMFAELSIEVFIANKIKVYFFEEILPMPELSFSVPFLNADLGIEITASHNEKNYNGFKIIMQNGSSPSKNEKDQIKDEIFGNKNKKITTITMKDVKRFDIKNKKSNKLFIISYKKSLKNMLSRQIIEEKYLQKIIRQIIQPNIINNNIDKLHIAYCSFNGTGINIIPKLFNKLKIKNWKNISSLSQIDPLFSKFNYNQILDPGDQSNTKLIISELLKEYGVETTAKLDLIMCNDPDSDRLSIIIKTENNSSNYKDWRLLTGDEMWIILLWYRLKHWSKKSLFLKNKEKMFITKSFVTTDSLKSITKNNGIDCYDSEVGFSEQSQKVVNCWEKNKINLGMFEESNGFSISGGKNDNSYGIYKHILEKDGILSTALIIEVYAYAKSLNLTMYDLLKKIYLETDLNFYINQKKDFSQKKQFDGLSGDLEKRKIIIEIEKFVKIVNLSKKKKYYFNNIPITSTKIFKTGKYDDKYWKNFPDEGIRFYLNNSKTDHVTIRSAGTEPKIRIFVQYKIKRITKNNFDKIKEIQIVKNIISDVENILKTMLLKNS